MREFPSARESQLKDTYAKILKILWALLLIVLPITSLPLVKAIFGGATVNPASVLPLVFLFILWLVPRLVRGDSLPQESLPLLAFVFVAFTACLLSFFLPIPLYKEKTILSRVVPALLTLATGVAFYLVTTTILRNKNDLIGAIKYINLGGVLMLVWAMAQSVVILFFEDYYPGYMHFFHRWLSIRDFTPGRVTAFAYEPSWFANQLSLLYFPIWLGMVACWRTIYEKRLWRVPLELVLVLVGVAAIFLARSRIGLLSLLSIVAFLVIRYAVKITMWVSARLMKILNARFPKSGRWILTLGVILLWILILALFIGIAVSSIYLASKLDWRMERIFNPDLIEQIFDDVGYVFSYQFSRALKFAERTAYWDAGLRVFDKFPLLGVGLGNAGFFFGEYIPAYGWRAPEVVQAIRPDSSIFPNPKSLWIRLLAETGFVGFTFFSVWIIVLVLRAWQLLTHDDTFYKIIGLSGLLGTITIVTEGFSLDTFGLPYMWILAGIISAAGRVARAESRSVMS